MFSYMCRCKYSERLYVYEKTYVHISRAMLTRTRPVQSAATVYHSDITANGNEPDHT